MFQGPWYSKLWKKFKNIKKNSLNLWYQNPEKHTITYINYAVAYYQILEEVSVPLEAGEI